MSSTERALVLAAFREWQVGEPAYGASRSNLDDTRASHAPKNITTDRYGRPPAWFKADELGYDTPPSEHPCGSTEGDCGCTLSHTLRFGLARNERNLAEAERLHAELNHVVARGIEARDVTTREKRERMTFKASRAAMLKAEKQHLERKRMQHKRAVAA